MTQPLAASPDPLPEAGDEAAPPPTLPPWSPARRLGFRFVFAYLALYLAPSWLDLIPGAAGIAAAYLRAWNALLPWLATHLLHLRTPMAALPDGGGDSTTGAVQLLCTVALAAAATLVWTLAARRSTDYRRLHALLRLYVRYPLACTMLGYGIIKLIKTQFFFPGATRLQEAYGEASPLGLLWTFMGYSTPYNVFTGLVETGGGLLLLFRRTTTAGALLAAAGLTNVVMINFSYDVHVKHWSAHLLLMAVFLLAPDLRRLADLLVLNRPTPPASPASAAPRRPGRRWLRIGRRGLMTALIAYFLVSFTWERWKIWKRVDESIARARARPSRLFAVDEYLRNGALVPASPDDPRRWELLWLGAATASVSLTSLDDTLAVDYGPAGRTLVVWSGDHKTRLGLLACSWGDRDHLSLTGKVANNALAVTLHRLEPSHFLLVKRGFHWINEFPLNR